MIKKYLSAIVAAATLTVAPYAALKDDNGVTLGDFALKVSRALGYEVRDRDSAARTLRAAGMDLGPDLNAKVTEGMASGILGGLGVKVNTAEPSKAITSGKLDGLVTSLALRSLSGIEPNTLPPPPFQCREIVKKDGRLDVGKCRKCCVMAITSPDPKDRTLRGSHLKKICDRFCKTCCISPFEPQF